MKTIELVAIKSDFESVTAYRLDTNEKVIWQGENDDNYIVPGEIFELEPETEALEQTETLTGKIIRQWINIPALHLDPLPVYLRDQKNQAYEMEQITPCLDHQAEKDPITQAIELKNNGAIYEALETLMNVVEADLRCIEGHVHLGHLKFSNGLLEYFTQIALKHYTIGVELGNSFLGEGFTGELSWEYAGNRPYLNALVGQCLSYWALNRFEEAEKAGQILLKLNKKDNLGVKNILDHLKKRILYKDFKQE